MDFLINNEDSETEKNNKPWNVLIVDDDTDVHLITKLALKDFELNGRHLKFTSVYSCEEAMQFLKSIDDRDIAVVLLDVVMETRTAGLELASFVREKLNNHFSRIILRTGQPADVPERDIVVKYDINDYKAKTDLTSSKLFISMVTNLRAYDELIIRKQKEIELAKSTKQLKISAKAKDTFIARMSHELLTPLNAILGFSQILQLNSQKEPEIIDNDLVGEILIASRHLKVLIEDTLDLVEDKETNIMLILNSCDLNNIIYESTSMSETLAQSKNITITFIPTHLKVKADYNRLKQCIINLLSNAIKFNLTDGRVNITVEQANTKEVDILVADTGVGMEESQYEEIFEKFSRLPYAEAQEIPGAGVGLTLVKKLVAEMNGTIGLRSKLGQGSVFWLRIPIDI